MATTGACGQIGSDSEVPRGGGRPNAGPADRMQVRNAQSMHEERGIRAPKLFREGSARSQSLMPGPRMRRRRGLQTKGPVRLRSVCFSFSALPQDKKEYDKDEPLAGRVHLTHMTFRCDDPTHNSRQQSHQSPQRDHSQVAGTPARWSKIYVTRQRGTIWASGVDPARRGGLGKSSGVGPCRPDSRGKCAMAPKGLWLYSTTDSSCHHSASLP